MRELNFEAMGSLIEDTQMRAHWQEIVRALHEAVQDGGPLHGWAFHGTSVEGADCIAEHGVWTTVALVNSPEDPDRWTEAEGTFWGTPAVAAFYAEDLIESSGEQIDMAIVAVRIESLEEEGDFSSDGMSLDCPLLTRLPLDEQSIHGEWERSGKGWNDCWRLYGSFVVLGPVGPEKLDVIRSLEDVKLLIERQTAPAPGL